MTKKELLKILDKVDDDFEIVLSHRVEDTTKPGVWPDFYTDYEITEWGGIVYSDKKIILDIEEVL